MNHAVRSAAGARPDAHETLVFVGHGSRDPRSAQALRRLTAAVAARTNATDAVDAMDVRVRLAFLELSEPLLEDVLETVSGPVRIVPLLLGSAFHARVDLPGRLAAVADARPDLELSVAGVLGPHPLLDAAVAARARDLLAGGCDGLVVLGTGSSHESANAEVDALADRLGLVLDVPIVAGFVTRGRTQAEAVAQLRASGATRIGLVPWFLAPGLLLDSGLATARELGLAVATVGASGPDRDTPDARGAQEAVTLADDEGLARLVLRRAGEPATPIDATDAADADAVAAAPAVPGEAQGVDDAVRRVLIAA